MGVRHLDTFIRENVPGGYFRVNIEAEIRKYFETVRGPNPPPPIIVIDLIALFVPLSQHDKKGLLFGGRFNLAYAVMDEFLAKLKSLGARLEFFYDGPAQDAKNATWCERQDYRYTKMVELVAAVDRGADMDTLLNQYAMPLNFRYPLRCIAKKYGEYRVAIAQECDQELATYATNVNALAIISDDSDFLIYKGTWKYWSSRQLELSTLFTMEYNRDALVRHLGLRYEQMPLFATLCGNDIMPYDVVKAFHYRLGQNRDKFPNIARFIRIVEEDSLSFASDAVISILLKEITNQHTVDNDLVQRFKLSLDNYSVNIRPRNINPSKDPVLNVLIEHDSPFTYLIWQKKQLDVSIGVVDMRGREFEHDFGRLQISLIVRMAGIILFHSKPVRPTHCPVIIKLDHQSSHREHRLLILYPKDLEVPTLPALMSKDPVIHEDLQTIKFQLLSWIASDSLKPDELRKIPQQLRMTVFTLYYLVEQRAIELFEADLFLQVAYDVTYETYDFRSLQYPRTISSRPFRVVFLYQKIYSFAAKAVRLVGLDDADNPRDDPPFDGVLFHKRYDDWKRGCCGLEHIKEWRIYEGLTTMKP
nr:constitutive coactivator of PPAR-gamma-like protein 1 [Aedes albopictus]